MAFNLGGTAAPAPATTAGGFSFGGTPAPAPAPGTAAPAPAFGSAPAPAPAPGTTTPAPAPAAAGGFSFGGSSAGAPAPATTAAPGTAAAPTPGAAPGAPVVAAPGQQQQTQSNGPKPTATVPPYHVTFPYLTVQERVRDALGRVVSTSSSSDNNAGGGVEARNLDAQELTYLLQASTASSATAAATTAANGTNAKNGPVGQLLSKPVPLKFVSPNVQLRQQLRTNPYLLLQKDDDDDKNMGNASAGSANGTVAGMTPQILDEILTLSDDLRLSEIDAASLYAGASDASTRRWLEGRLSRSFVGAAVQAGRCIDEEDGAGGTGQQPQQQPQGYPTIPNVNSADVAAGTGTGTRTGAAGSTKPSSSTNIDPLSSPRFGDDVLSAARELYFHERSCLLSTLLMLVRARVEASSKILQEEGANVGSFSSARAVLAATDQLLNANLVDNLVALARELTATISDVGRRIALGRVGRRDAKRAAAMAPPAPAPAAPAPAFGALGGGGVFGAPAPAAAPPAAPQAGQGANVIRDMDHVLLAFAYQSRQTVAECLFYLAYHTQLTGEEVGIMVDLIRDLTNGEDWQPSKGLGCGLPILDPVRDVPDIYCAGDASGGGSSSMQATPFGHPAPSPRAEKGFAAWKAGLVQSLWDGAGGSSSTPPSVGPGMPQLLQCTGSLVMAVLCALDPGQILMDRKTHGPNEFGLGNAILPHPGESGAVAEDQSSLRSIHSRLDPSAHSLWRRQDIAGLLCGAYALLLRPSAAVLTSPKVGGRSPTGFSASPRYPRQGGSVDIRRTFRSCVGVPLTSNSITFARASLLPSFGTSSMRLPLSSPGAGGGGGSLSSNFDFYMSVLSEFTSRYLDTTCAFGELPISRAQWLDDQNKNLQARHAQEEQRRQFGAFTGVQQQPSTNLPTEVDITERFDCVDDLVALVVAVCSICPECAHQFWSTVEKPAQDEEMGEAERPSTQYRLVPSQALRKLERVQAEEDSLLPTYLSFVAAIALANSPVEDERYNGAESVHSLLMGERSAGVALSSPRSASNKIQITWPFLLNMIRYYADELTRSETSGESSRAFSEGMRRSASGTYETDGRPSTAYYYGADSNATDGERGSYSSQQGHNGTASSSSTGGQQRFMLDDNNRFILLSILSLISHVASRCPRARSDILSMKAVSYGSADVGDDALITLFSLLICPVPPDVRGLTFVAIANLVRGEPEKERNNQEKERIAGYGKQAWALLEQTQLLPIGLLGQYAPMPDTSNFTAAPGVVNNAVSRAECMMQSGSLYYDQKSSAKQTASASAWFPSSKEYGIINEMEHVEAIDGCYPATEGLLYLLTSLVRTVGCPSDIGSQWRPRTGCTPYIEYIIDFVLPRAVGSMKRDVAALFFATPADKYRLVCRALEVIEAVTVRYMVPPPGTSSTAPSSKQPRQVSVTPNARGSGNDEAQRNLLSLEGIGRNYEATLRHASEDCGLSLVTGEIFPVINKEEELNAAEMRDAARDYRNERLSIAPPSSAAPETSYAGGSYSGQQHATGGFHTPPSVAAPAQHDNNALQLASLSVPCPKSAGFTILSNILSSTRGNLFFLLARLLIEGDGARGIGVHGQVDYSNALAMATFGNAPPIYALTKEAMDYHHQKASQSFGASVPTSLPATPSQWMPAFMRPLFPPRVHALFDKTSIIASSFSPSHDGVAWRELSVLLSLRVLCAAAGREEAFGRAVYEASASLSVVPVLQFRAPVQGSFVSRVLESYDVNVVRLSQLLVDSAGQQAFSSEVTPTIAQYVGYRACSLKDEEDMAKAAMSIVTYLTNILSHEDSLATLCGRSIDGGNRLAETFARRLLMPSSSSHTSTAATESCCATKDLRHLIMDLTLHYLQFGDGENLSCVLLGLSEKSFSVTTALMKRQTIAVSEVMKTHNCLDAALDLLSDINFVLRPETSSLAAKCYELVCRLYSSSNPSLKVAIVSKLRSRDFWYTNLLRFLGRSGQQSPSILHVVATRASSSRGEASSDYDVLHCIAWLLKGCAMELYALAGHLHSLVPAQDSTSMTAATLATQPTKCKRLLALLLSDPRCLMLKAMFDMPIERPEVAHHLGTGMPSRELVHGASKSMAGASDIVGSYVVVDPVILVSLLRKQHNKQGAFILTAAPNTEEEVAAAEWAKSWNAYAKYTCASSHLASAWGLVMGSSLVACQQFLFQGVIDARAPSSDSHPVLGVDGIVDLLCAILSRLYADPNKQSTRLEAAVALPMSAVALQLITELNHSADIAPAAANERGAAARNPNARQNSVEQEDMVKICTLVCAAIAACASGTDVARNDERAAILSCGLTDILASMKNWEGAEAFGEKMLLRSSWGEQDAYLNAAIHLAHIASQTGSTNDPSLAATGGANSQYGEKEKSMVFAARSGFTALITYFDWLEVKLREQVPSFTDCFLLKVCSSGNNNATSPGATSFARLANLIESYDVDAAYTLQQIASCRNGTYFLLNTGVTKALIAAASNYAKEAYGPGGGLDEIVEREAYGAREIQAPEFLHGHLLLLNTMLSLGTRELEMPARQRLLHDAAQVIQWYSATADRLLRSFPKDIDLVTELLTCLHLVASSLTHNAHSTGENKALGGSSSVLESMIDQHVLSRLERRVVDLAFHLSEFPFPSYLLPPVPTRLGSIERAKQSQNKHVSVNVSYGTSWWELLPEESSSSQVLHLSDPPTSAESGTWSRLGRSGFNTSASSAWTEQKYEYALASARCLEICLLFLQIRVNSTSSISSLPLDGLSLAKGLCRQSDASRAIQERCEHLNRSSDADLSSMMQNNFTMRDHRLAASTNYAEKVERSALLVLGPRLGRCASNLLTLVYAQSKKLNRETVMSHGTGTAFQVKNAVSEFAACIMPALEHTQIETMGIGCDSPSGDAASAENEFNKNTAKQVREELDRLSRGLVM